MNLTCVIPTIHLKCVVLGEGRVVNTVGYKFSFKGKQYGTFIAIAPELTNAESVSSAMAIIVSKLHETLSLLGYFDGKDSTIPDSSDPLDQLL